ncbi:MAG: response regulator [Candidatus Jacksonbacteria bacterium]|nr:response regulator [Candidatus Jacksonbacteria bacterium]
MKKILIVEDEQSLLKLLEVTFKNGGYEVIKAINAEEAYKGLEQNPDAVLLDILLPGENGIVVLEKIKKNNKTKHIPVIMLTNFNEPERFAKAKKKGAIDYLVKSSNDPTTVLQKVEKYLGNP